MINSFEPVKEEEDVKEAAIETIIEEEEVKPKPKTPKSKAKYIKNYKTTSRITSRTNCRRTNC